MVWIFEKKQEESPRKKSMDDYWRAKIKQSGVQAKIDHVLRMKWSADGKADASVIIKDLMAVCNGLERSGRIPSSAIKAVSRLVARWQGALDAGVKQKPLADYLELALKRLYTKFVLMTSILPSDIGEDIAEPPIEWFMKLMQGPQYQQQKPPAEELKD